MSAAPTRTPPRVVVVGAGPVGMTLANLLGVYGVPTLVLERETALFDRPRAVGTDFDCLRAWQAAGLADELLPDMVPCGAGGTGMVYLDARGRPFMEVRPEARPYGFAMGYTFVQPLVDRALLRGLSRFSHVETRFGAAVDEARSDAQGVTVRGRTAAGEGFAERAAFVVACDGGHSAVRRSLGIALQGRTLRDRWLVIDALADPGSITTRDVRIWCDPRRPAVHVPRPHDHQRFELLARPEESDALLLEPETIRRLLAKHADPDSLRVIRKLVYRFGARVARPMAAGRVLLAGDAAHVTPPFAAQGLAMGIRDAFNLAWKLAAVLQGRAGRGLLATYETERRPDVEATLRLALRLGRLMVPRSRLRARLQSTGVRALCRSSAVRRYLREGGPRPKPRIRSGFLQERAGRGATGWMLPQPAARAGGGASMPLDHWLGPGFALLGVGCAPERALTARTLARLRAKGARVLSLGAGGIQGGAALDDGGALAEWLGRGPRLLLVRPDRLVALDADPPGAEAALGALRKRLEDAA